MAGVEWEVRTLKLVGCDTSAQTHRSTLCGEGVLECEFGLPFSEIWLAE